MSKVNDPHPVYVILRDWTKANIHINTVAEKTERIPSLSFFAYKADGY